MINEILTKKEAAEFLRISIATINRLMKKRKIPFSKINGKVLFQRKDLIDCLERKKVK